MAEEKSEDKPKKVVPKRTRVNNFRSTEEQRSRIEALALQCGMRPSHYMLARALDYKPLARMNPIEEKVYRELVAIRTTIRSVSSRIGNMDAKQREDFYSSFSYLSDAIEKIASVAGPLNRICKKLSSRNKNLIQPKCEQEEQQDDQEEQEDE